MTERDDFLWDRSGEVDPTVQQLERLLLPLAHDGRELPPGALPPQRSPRRRRLPWLLAAAAAAVFVVGLVLWSRDRALAEGDRPRLFVATDAPMRIELGTLADVTLAPGSKLHFEHWRPDQALFRLEQGRLTARVAEPPAVPAGFFQIATALGRVVDQGCSYELRVDDDGTAHVRVTTGAVTFEFPQRTVFVPAGAATKVTATGPSTPLFEDCTPQLRRAVQDFDGLLAKGAPQMRQKGLDMVVQLCSEPRDSLVLWHLLGDADPLLREVAERALIDKVGPPEPPSKDPEPHWRPEVWLKYLRNGAWSQAK